ncbi:Protein scabrous, partial [Blattella germanica]
QELFAEENDNEQTNTLGDDKTNDKKYRHHRVLRMQVAELGASARRLSSAQAHSQHQLRRLEKQVKTLLNSHRGSGNHEAGAGEVAARQLQGRVSNLELASRMASKTVFNITRQLVGLDKLHQSMLQLLESVETLENKVDHSAVTTPQLETEAPSEEHFNSSSISQLVQELTRVQREYQQIISGLPRAQGPSGLYLISPGGQGTPLLASCDQDTTSGGWTVVQRRVDGSQEFNRKWSEYAAGFGSPSGEFWLGNEALHRLTGDNCSSLRVDIRDIYGKSWMAEYDEFSISDGEDGYRLHVAGYRGNASDALEYQNRMQFSTIDSDRDISNTHCAANYEGGWWFSHCQHANLNGRYNLGLTWFDSSKNEWIAVAWSEMKVRRRNGCEPHG